jgi:catechol 2,3-dioxygenase-like lactoylglutathione lyase family enzyme
MRSLIKETGVQSFFRGMPDAVLVLASAFFVAVLGLDLLIPDPLPFIDEFVLFMMTFGGTGELARRYRARRLASGDAEAVDRSAIPALSKPAAELRGLTARVNNLAGSAGSLSDSWGDAVASELRGLATDTRQMNEELRAHEAFLARTRNDPWQVDRQLTRLDRRVVELEVEGQLVQLQEACAERDALRAHRQRIEARIEDRQELLDRLVQLNGQVGLLSEDLRRLVSGSFDGTWAVAAVARIEPRIRAITGAVQAARDAEAEVEDAVRRRMRPSLARAGRVTA